LALHGHLPGVPGLTVGSTPVSDLRATPGDLPIAVLGEVQRHGATSSLAAFQSLRSEYSDHDSGTDT
jgi:hypothetical protein